MDDNDNESLYNASYHGNESLVSEILKRSVVDLNETKDPLQRTPFWVACFKNRLGVFRLLLNDLRVDITKPATGGFSPLMQLANVGNERMIAEMVASGRDLKLHMVYERGQLTALAISKARRFSKSTKILEHAETDPPKAIIECRKLIKMPLASRVCVLIVLHVDGYLDTRVEAKTNEGRFFNICDKLPMELQMTVCRILYDLPGGVITAKEFDKGFCWFLLNNPSNFSMFC